MATDLFWNCYNLFAVKSYLWHDELCYSNLNITNCNFPSFEGSSFEWPRSVFNKVTLISNYFNLVVLLLVLETSSCYYYKKTLNSYFTIASSSRIRKLFFLFTKYFDMNEKSLFLLLCGFFNFKWFSMSSKAFKVSTYF